MSNKKQNEILPVVAGAYGVPAQPVTESSTDIDYTELMKAMNESGPRAYFREVVEEAVSPLTEKEKLDALKRLNEAVVITAEELLNLGLIEIPRLLDPIFPKVGLAALVGSSETGKSAMLRQLTMAICSGEREFLGFPLQAEHHSAIYVSTEDDAVATASLLQDQNQGRYQAAAFRNLRYIFNGENAVATLKAQLKAQPADCVIVDAYSDIFSGDMNQSNQVRRCLNEYREIANEFNCLVLFLHHTGKRTGKESPSKDNVLGSQGFEAKMRVVIELRFDPIFTGQRHFCIVKGNYLKEEFKKQSFILDYDDHMIFHATGSRMDLDSIRKPQNTEVDRWASAKQKAHQWSEREGLSCRQISDRFKEAGINVGKTRVNEWLKAGVETEDDEEEGDE